MECAVRGSALLHTGIALRLDGELDEKRLTRAVASVFGRHELLATGFHADGETLTLGPAAPHETRVRYRPDLRPDDAGHLAEIRRWAAGAQTETFPLTGEAPARADLLILGEGEGEGDGHGYSPDDRDGDDRRDGQGDRDARAVLVLTFHRLVMDLFSLHQVVADLQEAYAADGPPAARADRYSALLAARENRRSRDWEFWRGELADFPTPWIGERRPEPGWLPAGAELRLPLPADLPAALRAGARAARCTPTVLVVAAAARRVLEHAGADDLVLGTMSANRMNSDAVGPLAQAVLVRVGSRAPSGEEGVLAQVRRGMREGMAHQGVEFEEIVELLTDEKGVARDDLAPLSVTVTEDSWRTSVAGLTFTPFDLEEDDDTAPAAPVVRPSQLDVELNLSDTRPELVVTYDRACFGPDWCARFAAGLLADLRT
ncbi:condensation domain-containing protein [Streptomyces sp. NPDC059894]|uniref:condensation domain-containing protein n=1 Tax=unclassified Streptomyces TaxID=2593676 RepID=UPI00365DC74A